MEIFGNKWNTQGWSVYSACSSFFLDVMQAGLSNYDEDFQTSRLVLMFSSCSLRTQGAPAAEGMILGAELHL